MKSRARSGRAETGTSRAPCRANARRCCWLRAGTSTLWQAIIVLAAPACVQTTLNRDPDPTASASGGTIGAVTLDEPIIGHNLRFLRTGAGA